MSRLRALPTQMLVRLIHLYRLLISPWIGQQCRFAPSCSHYMEDALITHGLCRGFWLGLRRLGRCHPYGGSGFDPVPPVNSKERNVHASH